VFFSLFQRPLQVFLTLHYLHLLGILVNVHTDEVLGPAKVLKVFLGKFLAFKDDRLIFTLRIESPLWPCDIVLPEPEQCGVKLGLPDRREQVAVHILFNIDSDRFHSLKQIAGGTHSGFPTLVKHKLCQLPAVPIGVLVHKLLEEGFKPLT